MVSGCEVVQWQVAAIAKTGGQCSVRSLAPPAITLKYSLHIYPQTVLLVSETELCTPCLRHFPAALLFAF